MSVLAGTDKITGEPSMMDPRGISFRELRAPDLDLMHRWLNAPHVRRWWYAEGTSHREIEEEYLPRIEGHEAVESFVILRENKPIGFVQSYEISHDEEYAGLVGVEDSAGLDMFIGEAEYLYQGLGQHIIRGFLSEHVFSDPGVKVCVIGPEPKNDAARRAYGKAGFHYFKTIQVPGEPEPEYLMKLTREEFEGDAIG